MTLKNLDVKDHSRDAAGLTYVYPVVSRRAAGVSVGVNLNPNQACNWRCVYCQVPNLTRGRAPEIDLALLERELRGFLGEVCHGDYLLRHVPEGARRLADIAISGDGEPTSAREFAQVVQLISRVRADFHLPAELPFRLITNGSYLHQSAVRDAIGMMAAHSGEVWFKLDGGATEDFQRINNVNLTPGQVVRNLRACAQACPTWVQTCLFGWEGQEPDEGWVRRYLEVLEQVGPVRLRGVLLYGVSRVSHQPEALKIQVLTLEALEQVAARIRALGLTVRVSA